MWLSLATIYFKGSRHSWSSSVFQTRCVDTTVVPYTTGKPNACFGSYSCQDATDLGNGEGLIGIPYIQLEEIIKALKRALSRGRCTALRARTRTS